MDENQKQYELVCILPPQLEGGDLDNVKKEIEEIINKQKGSISWGEPEKKELAYPINKQGQGIYLINQLSIFPEKIPIISNELKLNKQVLRHLIAQIPVIKPETKKSLGRKKRPTGPHLAKGEKGEKPRRPKVESKASLKEIDKKLDEIIKEI